MEEEAGTEAADSVDDEKAETRADTDRKEISAAAQQQGSGVDFQRSHAAAAADEERKEISVAEPQRGGGALQRSHAATAPVPETDRRIGKKVGRNAPCPCGSGKKYKKCCGA